jgi:hypothetical protein
MKDNQKTKKQLIDELDMLRQKMAAFEIAGSLRDASKAQQEDNAAKPKRKEGRSFQEEKLNFIIEQSGLTSWEWDIEHDRKTFNAIWEKKWAIPWRNSTAPCGNIPWTISNIQRIFPLPSKQ